MSKRASVPEQRRPVSAKNGKTEPERKILMEWTAHRAKERPLIAIGVILVIATALAIGWTWVHPLISVMISYLLLKTLAEFLFPVTYRLTEAGVTGEAFLLHRFFPWERVRRVTLVEEGVHLSPFSEPHTLDGIRGFFLFCPENKDQVFELCSRNSPAKGKRKEKRERIASR
ncbi:MAG: hypothetical protein NZ959_00145 [Armatimonadetes bacterium]|nr:hypothetical protein [Armatimonadota bacterium]MDW8120723.1 hypothetical protein [Armatimonadota bacterium]